MNTAQYLAVKLFSPPLGSAVFGRQWCKKLKLCIIVSLKKNGLKKLNYKGFG